MNANELANLLEVDSWYKLVTREEIATMLRQQQTEIEALKVDLKYWTNPCDPLCKPSICDCYKARFAISNRKTLTDEEIRVVWYGHPEFKDGLGVDPIPFARAILRKAQEK